MQWIDVFLRLWESLGVWSVPVETAIRSLLLMALTFATARLLTSRSAGARQALWAASLVALLVLPLLTAVGPEWQVPVAERQTVAAGLPISEVATIDSAGPVSRPAPATQSPNAGWSPGTWVGLCYGAGVFVVLLRWLVGSVRLQRRVRGSRPVHNTLWRRDLVRLGREIGARRTVHLRACPGLEAPLSSGIIRPSILLPVDALRWPQSVRRTVLLHELTHIRRHDLLLEQLTQLASAVYWFNPMVWLAARQLRLEREKACDDAVLASGTRPSDYARQLLFMAVRGRNLPTMAGIAMANRNQLEGRLMAILDQSRRRSRIGLSTAMLSVVAVALVVPLAGFSPTVTFTTIVEEPPSSPLASLIQQLYIKSQGASISEDGIVFRSGGWFRVEEPGGALRAVEIRETGQGREQVYTIDGVEQPWGSEAEALLKRGIDQSIEEAHLARQEALARREQAENARLDAEVAELDARVAREEARHQQREVEILQQELRDRVEIEQRESRERMRDLELELHQRALESEKAMHELQKARQESQRGIVKELEHALQQQHSEMEALQRQLQRTHQQLEGAEGQNRAELEQQLADRQMEIEQRMEAMRAAQIQVKEQLRDQLVEIEAQQSELEKDRASELVRVKEELEAVQRESEYRLQEVHEQLMETEAQLSTAHEQMQEMRSELEEVLRQQMLEALEESGATPEQSDVELIALVARKLSHEGSLHASDGVWSFEPHPDIVRELSKSLAGKVSGLADEQRRDFAERLVDRLSYVEGN